MKRILFSDMDGTIIHKENLISEKDREMMYQMHEAGHLIAFCTGRNELEAKSVIQQHELPCDYLVLNNGGQIMTSQGEELFRRTIPREAGLQILERYQRKGCYLYFYDSEKHLTCGVLDGVSMTFDGITLTPSQCDFMEEARKANAFDIISIMPRETEQAIAETARAADCIKAEFGDAVEATLNTIYLDITPKGQSKGSGLLKLVSLLPEAVETYCIGDSFNDISMFHAADHSFTFSRSEDLIKAHADHCVDYVYEVIEQILTPDKNI